MIQKVSDQEKVSWLDLNEGFNRQMIDKSATDSFVKQILSMISLDMKANPNLSLADAAANYNLDLDVLNQMLIEEEKKKIEQTKVACACEQKTTKEIEREEALERLAQAEKAREELYSLKRVDVKSAPQSSKSIISNKYSEDTSNIVGGSGKFLGCEGQNSIFQPNRVEELAKVKSNGERIREDNANELKRREKNKEASKYQCIDLEQLEEFMMKKEASVNSIASTEHVPYTNRVPANGISIFDEKEFERLPEKSKGDERREELAKLAAAPKDRSWVQKGASCVKSSQFVDQMIENIMKYDENLKKSMSEE